MERSRRGCQRVPAAVSSWSHFPAITRVPSASLRPQVLLLLAVSHFRLLSPGGERGIFLLCLALLWAHAHCLADRGSSAGHMLAGLRWSQSPGDPGDSCWDQQEERPAEEDP